MMMLKLALFLVCIMGLFVMQLPSLLIYSENKEALAYAALMLFAAVIGGLLILDVQLPSPATPLKSVFEPVTKWLFPTA
jgi:formate-dependent nitrite reductase membrane component NrfD